MQFNARSYLLVFFLMCGFGQAGFAQQNQKKQDSLVTAKDSTYMAKLSRDNVDDSKFVKRIKKLIFRKNKTNIQSEDKGYAPEYESYEGTIIRHITLKGKKPLGYSLKDSLREPHSVLEKAGNTLHIRSMKMAIGKFLLFKENEALDSLSVLETQRLLREQSYIRDVQIVPRWIGSARDSVDLTIEYLDSWTLIPKARFSSSYFRAGLRERNFLGTGHKAQLDYGRRFSDSHTGIHAKYMVPNIANTFIDITGNYRSDFDHYQDKYLSVNREFYSPLARWAGGIFWQERSLNRFLMNKDLEYAEQDIKFTFQDYWAGYAVPVFQNSTGADNITNLFVNGRVYLVNYKEAPTIEFDPTYYFSDEKFYLMSFGINSQGYVKDHHIFRDGAIEDVPTGSLYTITAGVQEKKYKNRLYLGTQASRGYYLNWGFLSTSLEMGSFFRRGKMEQAVINLKATYFSELMDIGTGKWKVRQFIKPQIVLGINRENSLLDRLGLNEQPYYRGVNNYEYMDYESKHRYIDYDNGNIQGFRSSAVGTRKYVLDLQTQFYSPWELMGFRLNPFIGATFGLITGGDNTYKSNKFYSAFNVGFIIRNDYLIFDSFQLSLSYFPSMPGTGSNVFRVNSFSNEDFGFQDFRSNRPRPVIYE